MTLIHVCQIEAGRELMVVRRSAKVNCIFLSALWLLSECATPPMAYSQSQSFMNLEAESQKDKANGHSASLIRALEFLKKKEFEKAIELCTELIAECATDSDFYFFRALAYQEVSKYENALADLNKAIELKPQNLAEIYYHRAVLLHKLKQPEAAFEDCNTAIKLDPKYPESYAKRAELNEEKKQMDQAIIDWSILIELAPSAFNYTERALAYEEIEDLPKAIADYDKAIELNSVDAFNFYRRAKVKSRAKMLLESGSQTYSDHGLSDISKAISLKPKEPAYLVERAHIYSRLLQFPEAVNDCTSAIHLAPNNDELYSERGDLYLHLKQFNSALSDYSKAIALKPKNPHHYLRRAKVYETLCTLEKSFQDCSKAIDVDPKGNGAKSGYINRGNLFVKQGNFKNAVDEYTKATEIKTDDVFLNRHVYYRRSKAYANLGQHSKAISDYSKWSTGSNKDIELFYYDGAIKDHPKEAWAYAGRGEAFRVKGLNKQAIEDCTISIALNPKYAPAYATRGLAYKHIGDQKAALSDFHKAVSLDPNYAQKLSNSD